MDQGGVELGRLDVLKVAEAAGGLRQLRGLGTKDVD